MAKENTSKEEDKALEKIQKAIMGLLEADQFVMASSIIAQSGKTKEEIWSGIRFSSDELLKNEETANWFFTHGFNFKNVYFAPFGKNVEIEKIKWVSKYIPTERWDVSGLYDTLSPFKKTKYTKEEELLLDNLRAAGYFPGIAMSLLDSNQRLAEPKIFWENLNIFLEKTGVDPKIHFQINSGSQKERTLFDVLLPKAYSSLPDFFALIDKGLPLETKFDKTLAARVINQAAYSINEFDGGLSDKMEEVVKKIKSVLSVDERQKWDALEPFLVNRDFLNKNTYSQNGGIDFKAVASHPAPISELTLSQLHVQNPKFSQSALSWANHNKSRVDNFNKLIEKNIVDLNDFKDEGFNDGLPSVEIIRLLLAKDFDFSAKTKSGEDLINSKRLNEDIQYLKMEVHDFDPEFMPHPMMHPGFAHREYAKQKSVKSNSIKENLIVFQLLKSEINPISQLSDLKDGLSLKIQLSVLSNAVWKDSKPALGTLSSLVSIEGTPVLYSFKEAPVLSFTPEDFSDGVFANEKYKVKLLSWKPELKVEPKALPKP